jgi:hypothetical protein
MSDDKKRECSSGDEIHLGAQTESGFTMAMRHREDHTLQACLLRPLSDGQPIPPGAELVRLSKKEGDCYNVQSLYKSPGPANVTTDEYRVGWDRVFGARTPRGEA